jgi:hypothetical protein
MLKRMLSERVFDIHAPLGTPQLPSLEFEYSGLWGGKITFYDSFNTPRVLMSLSGWDPQSGPSYLKTIPDQQHYAERTGPLIERPGQTLRLVIHVTNHNISLVNRETYRILLQLPLPHYMTSFMHITAQGFEYIYSVDTHIKPPAHQSSASSNTRMI